jgi:hypothetical protein
VENCPGNISCQRNPSRKNRPGIKLIGTGLSSTLLSSQRTTTHRRTDRHLSVPAPGALVQLYLRYFLSSNPGSDPNLPTQNNCEGTTEHYTALSRAHFVGSSRTAAAGPRGAPLARPSPWRLGKHYNASPRPPNRPSPLRERVRTLTPCGQRPGTVTPVCLAPPTH